MRGRTRALGAFLIVALTTGGPAWATAAAPRALHRVRTAPHASRPALRAASRLIARAPAQAQSELVQLQRQLLQQRRVLAQTQQRERRVLGQLSWAQERLQLAQASLRQTTAALDSTRREIARATRDLAALSGRLAEHEALMGARLRAFYETGPLGYLDVLLGATGFRDFATRTYLIGLIIDHDLTLYRQVATERQKRDEVRAALEEQQQQLQAQQERWRASREETARLAAERRRLLEHVRAERAAQEEAVRELEVESGRIRALILRSTKWGRGGTILTLGNGLLVWPVSGPISSGYGWRIHPIFGTREFHTGIDIAAPWGAPIQAAADGAVLFTGWMRGYGMLVILDHGNGLSTTYSHLSSYSVRAGQRVARGQVIARIGSTGWSTGPHLFFEVRENGRPVDPLGP